jgi:hypothetical protein
LYPVELGLYNHLTKAISEHFKILQKDFIEKVYNAQKEYNRKSNTYNSYKPDYKTEYKQEYKPDYKPDYKPEYKPEYK